MQSAKSMTLGEGAVRRRVSQFDAKQQGQSGTGKPLTEEPQRISTAGVKDPATARRREEIKKSVSHRHHRPLHAQRLAVSDGSAGPALATRLRAGARSTPLPGIKGR